MKRQKFPLTIWVGSKPPTSGFSLVELILAVALFGLFATAFIGLLVVSYDSDVQAAQRDRATLYAQEGMDAVFSIRRQGWNLLNNGTYGLTDTNGYYEFFGSSNVLEDLYTREITITDACRDGGGELTDCPGVGADLKVKKVTATVSYTGLTGFAHEIVFSTYVSTWQTAIWTQTEWSGGGGQPIWSDETQYSSDDGKIDVDTTAGQVTLATITGGGCGVKTWPFSTAGEYTYNSSLIEITSSVAQLVAAAGGASGPTTNPDFSVNTNGWTYSDWDQGGGEVNVTGARQASGGNPTGYVQVNVPSGSNDELGGSCHQAFPPTVNNPPATLDFDWVVTVYDAVPNTFQLYIFVDTASGAPTIGTEVWSSGEITSAQGWNSETSIDISSAIPTAGTYYLKIAVWVETGNSNTGPFEAGYDNVELNWVGGSNNFCSGTPAACTNYGDQPLCENQSGCLWSASVSYPTDNPLISPTNSYVGSNIQNWTAFNETADKGGGEIYYQLSDNNGSTWQYWNGSSWTAAGLSQYNTASVVNTNISAFSTSSGQISFRAFLASDGSQQVQLSNVKIGWGQDASDGGYETSGLLTSSAFPMTAVATEQASVAILEWDEVIPSCTPSCQLQLQVRTAPDASGSPGSWSDWYGNSGSGSYFTNPLGTVLSVDLNDARWAEYRALFTGDGNDTPVLTEVRLQYLP